MGKIDDPHDAENQRQAAAHQEQQRAIRYPVEGLDDPKLRIHSPSGPSVGSKVAATLHEVCRK